MAPGQRANGTQTKRARYDERLDVRGLFPTPKQKIRTPPSQHAGHQREIHRRNNHVFIKIEHPEQKIPEDTVGDKEKEESLHLSNSELKYYHAQKILDINYDYIYHV